MKRDDLIKALRTTPGKIKVHWRLVDGLSISPNVEKSSLIEEFMKICPQNIETGFYISDSGYLVRESDR